MVIRNLAGDISSALVGWILVLLPTLILLVMSRSLPRLHRLLLCSPTILVSAAFIVVCFVFRSTTHESYLIPWRIYQATLAVAALLVIPAHLVLERGERYIYIPILAGLVFFYVYGFMLLAHES